MSDQQLQALGIDNFYPAAPLGLPGNVFANQPLYHMPGAQGIQQNNGQPQRVQGILAPAPADFQPAWAQAVGQQAVLPQPLQRAQPIIPIAPVSNRRKSCYPCHRGGKECDRLDQIATAQANGIDTAVNPVCCSNCQRKATNQAGFQASYCVVDPATSLNAGLQGYLDGWAAKRRGR